MIRVIMMLMILSVLLSGCTTRNWYEGLKAGHSYDCSQLDGDARDKCLGKDMSYDEYQKTLKDGK